jgi:asparagine synthase (glutamine-hydrolysing)
MQYFVMQAAKRAKIPVLLDGQGGDETLLGYERYLSDYCLQLLQQWRMVACARTLKSLALNGRTGIFRALLWNLLYFHAIELRRSYASRNGQILRKEFLAASDFDEDSTRRYSRLVEMALSLSADLKLKDGWTKFILRKALRNDLPQDVVWRKTKFGFEAPESRWMRAHSANTLATIRKSPLLQEICEAGTLTEDRIAQLDPGMRWRLHSAALWAEQFGVGELA